MLGALVAGEGAGSAGEGCTVLCTLVAVERAGRAVWTPAAFCGLTYLTRNRCHRHLQLRSE